MSRILHVSSSPRGAASFSNQVAATLLDDLKESHPGAEVTVRDLAGDPLPHIGGGFVRATRTSEGPQNAQERAALERSDALVDEVLAADIIVVGAPMYNFGIASTLKAWIDHIARPGRTFRYNEDGPEGMLKGKRVIIVGASGGVYSDGPYKAFEHAGSYLRTVFGFLGVTDIQQIDVEGVALGNEQAGRALASGAEQAHGLARERMAA